ncbi:hypothetical protein [Sulfurospirillum sp. 1612]|uniref:hypothetical protein n=1 Tax=Sulfurospirillum sp. 1612 TaxID=3094835 RepID=UPI002F92E182
MTAMISLLPIFGYASIFYIYFRKSVSVSIFFSISAIISVLYIFGMFDVLKYGAYLLFYFGFVLFLFLALKFQTKMLQAMKSVPFMMFVFCSVIYLYLMKDAHLFFWDEYSHWGAFIKEMYYFDHFYDASSVAANLSYPPGISIWDYFIIKPIGFSEGGLYFAYFLILFSATLMMYERLSFKQIHWIGLIFVVQMVLFADFGHGFSSIYVDHVVGAVFAGLILSFIDEKFSIKNLYLFIFPLLALNLIKEVGFILDLFFLGFVFIVHIINSSRENQVSYLQSIKNNKKTIATLVILFILVFAAFKAWNIRQESEGIHNNGITMGQIITHMTEPLSPKTEQMEAEISRRFSHVFVSQQVSKNQNSLNYNEFSFGIMPTYKDTLKLTGLGVFFLILLFSIVVYFSTKKSERNLNLIIINLFLIVIFAIHVGLLYLSYRNGFGTGGLRIPSYVRYINTIILPILVVQFSLLLPLFQDKSSTMRQFFAMCAILIALIVITKPYMKPLYSQLENGFRKNVDLATKNIVSKVPQKKKLFVIFPIKNNGSLNNILKYSLIPTRATISKATFADKTPEQMIEIFSQYDYIWFASLNKEIFDKSKMLLKAKDKKHIFVLYKVNLDGHSFQLKPII